MRQGFLKKIHHFRKDKFLTRLIIFGILYRMVFFVIYPQVIKVPDSQSFWDLASFVGQLDISGYNGQRSPGYPMLLCLTFGYEPVIIIIQFVLGILTSMLWYKTLRNLSCSGNSALWTTIFIQSFSHLVLYELSILVETLSLFIISVIFWLVSAGFYARRSSFRELLMSALLAYLVLVKPFFAFIPFVIFGFYLFQKWDYKLFLGRRILIIILPLISYFGWSYINKINTGYFVSTTYYGLNLAQNCVHFAEKGPQQYNWIIEPYVHHREIAKAEDKDVAMSIWYAFNSGAFNEYGLDFAQLSNEFGAFAKATIAESPEDYFYQAITISWADFWKPWSLHSYITFPNDKADEALKLVWSIQSFLLMLLKFAYLLLMTYYFYKFLRTRTIRFEVVAAAVIFSCSVLQALVTYGTNAKYSFPFEFLMLISLVLFMKKAIGSRRQRTAAQF